MKPPPNAVTVERIGSFVELVVGPTTLRMTTDEAEAMVKALERAIDPPLNQKHIERIH